MYGKLFTYPILCINLFCVTQFIVALLIPLAARLCAYLIRAAMGRPDVYFGDDVFYTSIVASLLILLLAFAWPKRVQALNWIAFFSLSFLFYFLVHYPLKS